MPSSAPADDRYGAAAAAESAYASISKRIATAVAAAGRPPGAVTLTAVSKQQPWDAIVPVLAAGHRVFGENRVQEAQARWAQRRADGASIELRLIGPLQSNKAAEAAALFDVIETLDRDRLAQALARAASASGAPPRLYVQVNTGEEAQKTGVAPHATDAFVARLRRDYDLPIAGLMCIPPQGEPPGPHFALLAKLAIRNGLDELSMGMSGDFETAIRFGATSVRVGSALFGHRDPATGPVGAPGEAPAASGADDGTDHGADDQARRSIEAPATSAASRP